MVLPHLFGHGLQAVSHRPQNRHKPGFGAASTFAAFATDDASAPLCLFLPPLPPVEERPEVDKGGIFDTEAIL